MTEPSAGDEPAYPVWTVTVPVQRATATLCDVLAFTVAAITAGWVVYKVTRRWGT